MHLSFAVVVVVVGGVLYIIVTGSIYSVWCGTGA